MQLDPTAYTLIRTAVGAIAGIGGTILSTWIVQRSEERRHLRQVVLNAAIENWKLTTEHGRRLAEAGYSVINNPIDSYVINIMKLVSILNERNLTEDRMRTIMRDIYTVTAAANEEVDRYNEKPKNR